MRTGAIFARGSCRALTWVLALCASVVIGAGEALAQEPKLSKTRLTLVEGASDTITLTVDDGTAGDSDDVVVSLESIEGGTFDLSWRGSTSPGSMAVDTGVSDATINVPENATVRITATANDDSDATDARAVLSFTISGESTTLILRANDRDTSGVIVSERALTVLEGDIDGESYTVKLGTAPSDDVTVTAKATTVNARIMLALASDIVDDPATTNVDESRTASATSQALTFTTANWSVAQTVYVTAIGDNNTTNGSASITNKAASVDGDYSGVSGRTVRVTEIDSVRTVTLTTSADTVEEGKAITITATLGSSVPDSRLTLSSPVVIKSANKDKTAPILPPSSDYDVDDIVIAADSTAGSTTLMAKHDRDESDETLTLTASIDSAPGIIDVMTEEVTVTLVDDDTYTLEANDYEVNEGDEVTLAVKVDPKAALETKVEIELYRASGATVKVAEDYDADPTDDTIAILDEGEATTKFTLKTARDTDSDNEVVEVQAKVGTAVIGSRVRIDVVDGQAYTLSVKPDSIGEADGESSVRVKVETNKVVSATKDTMLTLAVDAASSTATDPDDYSIMPAEMMVTIPKGEKMGMTELMVTPVMDSMDEPNETIVLTAWKDDKQAGNAATLTIVDGDSPGSGITPKSSDEVGMVFSDAIEMAGGLMVGGNMVTVDMSMLFNMANPNAEVMYSASSSNEEVLGSSSPGTMLTLNPMMAGMSTVSVEAKAGGMAAGGAVTAFTCMGACVSVNLDVMGATTFMLTGPEDMDLPEGMFAKVMVTASSAVVADTEVSLMRDGTSTASMDDYSVEPMMATIMAGETMAEFEVMATDDEMMEDEAEMLTLFLVVDDMQMTDQSVSFYLWDAAVPALPAIAQLLLAAFLALGRYRRYLRR